MCTVMWWAAARERRAEGRAMREWAHESARRLAKRQHVAVVREEVGVVTVMVEEKEVE